MPNAGNHFTTTLQQAHLEWGNHRHTNSRGIIYGEGYLQIPSDQAYALEITNNSSTVRSAEYDFDTSDGFITGSKLLASGNQSKSTYAKQFHGSGDLQLLGDWYNHIGAEIGDNIKIEFVTPTQILLTKL